MHIDARVSLLDLLRETLHLHELEGTRAIVMVPRLDEDHERLRSPGANILQGPGALSMGRRLFAETPDRALTTEWVEHRSRQAGRPGAG